MTTIEMLKSNLRTKIKAQLNALSAAEKSRQSDIVAKKLLSLDKFKKSNRVSIYLSTANEINTVPILEAIFSTGKSCFVPRYSGNVMQMVKLVSKQDYDQLPVTKWNIKQPSVDEKREEAFENGGLDFIIVPGMAFTKFGHRLGHGKGYYDKFLTKCINEQNVKPSTVALAFNEQILDEVPCTERDVQLDTVLYSE